MVKTNKFQLILILLALLILLIPACGGGDDEPTSTLTAAPIETATPSVTPANTQTPTATVSSGPVKIGAIQPWSGPLAASGGLADQMIAVVEDQIKEMGGILGGRELKFVRGDDAGSVAQSAAQAKKLAIDDKVAFLTLGGVGAASFSAVSDVAEDVKVPYVAFSTIHGIQSKKYSLSLYAVERTADLISDFVINELKPEKVAFMAFDSPDARSVVDGSEDMGVVGVKKSMETAGINLTSIQLFQPGTSDFTPYLTKVKYENPDVFVTHLNSVPDAITIVKQMSELGGFGDITYFCATPPGATRSAVKQDCAVGSYVGLLYVPGSTEPGMKSFEDAFVKTHNRMPDVNLSYYYNCFWTAIKAIELAGTDDPDKIAEVMRTGNFEWDSSWGPLRFGTDGIGQVIFTVVQVQEGGKLVTVWPE